VSKGLGETQLRMLAALEEHYSALGPNATGMTIDELGRGLALEERRTRAVVASLVDRDLVTVVTDGPGPGRVWGRRARRGFLNNQELNRYRLEALKAPYKPTVELTCPNCGAWVPIRPPNF
jgi:hypothetical protein